MSIAAAGETAARTAAIIGAGIGGLAAALLLQRRGWEAHVFEAAPDFPAADSGGGILLAPNAMQVLERMGLALPAAVAGAPLERIDIASPDGAALQSIDLAPVRRALGQTAVGVARADLLRLLAERLRPGTLHLDCVCVGYERRAADGEGAVAARFADGSAVAADVLVGADGLHSAVRRQMFLAAALRYADQTGYQGIAAGLRLPDDLGRACRDVWGAGRSFRFFPVGPERVAWLAAVDSPRDSPDRPGAALPRLRRLYGSFPAPIPEILAATPSESLVQADLYDCPDIQGWCDGSAALLGDAVHAAVPSLAQGAAQALEDAWELADRLAAPPPPSAGGVAGALREYERIRRPRAARALALSWQVGRAANAANPLLRGVRDFALQLTPEWVLQRQLESLCRAEL